MKQILTTAFGIMVLICSQAQVYKGQPAPPISLPSLEGNRIQLSDLRGKVVLIDFWASWCGPCRKHNPELVKLYHKYHERGLEILGISVDEDPTSWRTAVRADGLDWIQVIDKGGNKAGLAYGVNQIPVSFLVDRDGNIHDLDLEGRMLESKIKALLHK